MADGKRKRPPEERAAMGGRIRGSGQETAT